LLNTMGFYNPLLKFIEHTVTQGFVRRGQESLMRTAENPTELIHLIKTATAGQETYQELRP